MKRLFLFLLFCAYSHAQDIPALPHTAGFVSGMKKATGDDFILALSVLTCATIASKGAITLTPQQIFAIYGASGLLAAATSCLISEPIDDCMLNLGALALLVRTFTSSDILALGIALPLFNIAQYIRK
jgi:hypothetical protein